MFLTDRLHLTTQREYTDEGFLKVPARISRVGIQTYLAVEMGLTDREPTDIIRIFRSEEEVFSDQSLKSFANKPVTDNHPPELVNTANAKQFTVGMSGPEVVRNGDFAETILHITDATAIKNIESGKVELSNGYTADIDWVPGVTPTGESFDASQRNIKGNHIAIVEHGRAGSACRVADNLSLKKETKPMGNVTIDGVDFEVSDQAAQAVRKLQARVKDAEEETKISKEEAKKKEDEMEEAKKKADKTEDSLKAKLDDANSKLPTTDALDKLVQDRILVVDSIRKVMPEIKFEGKDADTLRKEVVAAKCPNVQMDSVSSDYIKARFDMLLDSVTGNSQHDLDKAFSKHVTNDLNVKKDNRPKSVIARDNAAERARNAWKPKVVGGAK